MKNSDTTESTEIQAQRIIDDTRGGLNQAKISLEITHNLIARFQERNAQALMNHIMTADQWVVAYGAGLAFISIEGVGFLADVLMPYRATASLFAMIALIILGVEKILRREAVKKANESIEEMRNSLECVFDMFGKFEIDLKNLENEPLNKKIKHVLDIKKELAGTLMDWDKDIDGKKLQAELILPILKYRLDLWSLAILAIGSLVIVIGTLHSFT